MLKNGCIRRGKPNGYFGLLAWYPGAKTETDDTQVKTKKKPGRPKKKDKTAANGSSNEPANNGDSITFKEIRDVILAQEGQFSKADIDAALREKFPLRKVPKTKVPSVIFILKKDKGLLREVTPRSGKKAAIYTKA